jgi:hypothetical protein
LPGRVWPWGTVAEPAFRGALGLCCGVLAAVPARHRFSVALGASRIAARLLPRRAVNALRSPGESTLDAVVGQVLRALRKRGIGHAPRVRVDGIRELDEAVAAGRGVLLAGPHTRLTIPALYHLYERGYDLAVVTWVPVPPPPGRFPVIPQIHRSPFFLVAVREALREGRTVFAMVDRHDPLPGLTTPVQVAGARLYVTDALLRLAARCRARTLFIASRVEGGGIRCTIQAPRPAAGGADEASVESFTRFVEEFARRARPRHPGPEP